MANQRISRERMVREQIAARGVTDPLVLEALGTVPRHRFVEEALLGQAYEDRPLPIGYGQTISQPYVVAAMSATLDARPGMSVLEIGTGSGYQAAVLRQMGLTVFSVERIRELHLAAARRFRDLRMMDVRLRLDDGTLGWPDAAPFDRIIVTAGGPAVPVPLLDQLADPGILVIPVGREKRNQRLVRIIKSDGDCREEEMEAVAFVDLVGKHGW